MHSRNLLLAVLLAALPGLAAAQPVLGPYVSLGGGAGFLQDQSVRPFHGLGPSPRDYRFDAGAAADAAVGYGLGNGVRLEVEGDYTSNHVRGARLSAPTGIRGVALQAGGHEQQFGGFANALYDFGLGLPVTPYLGVGAGYQEIGLDHVTSSLPGVTNNTGIENRGNFAYQAIAGLGVAVPGVRGLSLGVEYRFVGVLTPPAFDRGPSGRTVNGTPLNYRATFGNIFNHEALLSLRYAFDTAPPPLASPPVTAPLMARSRAYLVFFDWDRADLTARARQIIAEAAQNSTRVQTTRIEVNGYTDLSGTAAYNQSLSVRRARSVEAELVHDGVPRGEIAIHGYGESNPLVPTAKGVREPQNRRVEIILH